MKSCRLLRNENLLPRGKFAVQWHKEIEETFGKLSTRVEAGWGRIHLRDALGPSDGG